jgi:hypothetical protein
VIGVREKEVRERAVSIEPGSAHLRRNSGPGRDAQGVARKDQEMAGELEHYWFVAAVFRGQQDLAAAAAELAAAALAPDCVMVVSRGAHEDASNALQLTDTAALRLVTMQADGNWRDGDARMPPLGDGLRCILQGMGGSMHTPHAGSAAIPVVRNGRAQIYAQLRQDVADGAYVLIANVANAQEQLHGARILLKGNCECVLTHEIAV